jgi:hypothetical protein
LGLEVGTKNAKKGDWTHRKVPKEETMGKENRDEKRAKSCRLLAQDGNWENGIESPGGNVIQTLRRKDPGSRATSLRYAERNTGGSEAKLMKTFHTIKLSPDEGGRLVDLGAIETSALQIGSIEDGATKVGPTELSHPETHFRVIESRPAKIETDEGNAIEILDPSKVEVLEVG